MQLSPESGIGMRVFNEIKKEGMARCTVCGIERGINNPLSDPNGNKISNVNIKNKPNKTIVSLASAKINAKSDG
jgi:hypothetical protein